MIPRVIPTDDTGADRNRTKQPIKTSVVRSKLDFGNIESRMSNLESEVRSGVAEMKSAVALFSKFVGNAHRFSHIPPPLHPHRTLPPRPGRALPCNITAAKQPLVDRVVPHLSWGVHVESELETEIGEDPDFDRYEREILAEEEWLRPSSSSSNSSCSCQRLVDLYRETERLARDLNEAHLFAQRMFDEGDKEEQLVWEMLNICHNSILPAYRDVHKIASVDIATARSASSTSIVVNGWSSYFQALVRSRLSLQKQKKIILEEL